MIIPDFLEKNARVYPNKTAIIYQADNTRATYQEMVERVYRLANGLLGLGIRKGDRIGIIQDNCFEWLEMYVGIGKIGAVATPLNYRLIGQELAALINHSESNTLIVGKDFVEVIRPFKDKMPFLKNYIVLGDKVHGMVNYNELLDSSSSKKPEVEVSRDDLFCLLYTGGTTGQPKGAMFTHHKLFSLCIALLIEWGMPYHDDVGMIVTPLFHTGSNWPLFAGFMMGNTQVILKGVDFKTVFETIEKEKITYTWWLPAIAELIINDPQIKEYDLSSLKMVMTGGGPLGEPRAKRMLDRLGCRVGHGGGQTETGPITHFRVEEHLNGPPERLGSAGKEAFNIESKVVDENDNEVPPGVVGELCARGEAVMQGYWRMPEETQKSMRGGWQHTGDLVRKDEEGFIYFVDRSKDMIKSGGENVFSIEVEDVIYALPQVAEVAVIGVPDERWGELIKALVILKEGERITEKEIIAHCKQRLAGFKCPKSIEFYDRFPKTGLGKIAKNVLREKYWKGFKRRIH